MCLDKLGGGELTQNAFQARTELSKHQFLVPLHFR
jgi:hypothetical protein